MSAGAIFSAEASCGIPPDCVMAHPDLDKLMNVLLGFATSMLKSRREFLPFAAVIDMTGEVVLTQPDPAATGAHPSSEAVIDSLITELRRGADQERIRAAAICLDVRATPPGKSESTDAVAVRLEHANGEAVEAFLPYRRSWLGRYSFGQLFAGGLDHQIFNRRT